MTTWDLADSLDTMRAEANTMAPGRSKRSDGTIGDAAHADRPSRHNPNKRKPPKVTAWDGTDDPAAGFPVHVIMRWLAREVLRPLYLQGIRQETAPEPWSNVAYFITADEVMGWHTGWLPRKYKGSNRHLLHGHSAVGIGSDSDPRPPYDSRVPWDLIRAIMPANPSEELTMADISQILAGQEAIQKQLKALTLALNAQAAHGAFDYGEIGGDTNALWLEVTHRTPEGIATRGQVVQRTFADGQWRAPLPLGEDNMDPHTFAGPIVRGRRIDYFAQKLDGRVVCFTFDPDQSTSWQFADLPAIS